MNKLEQALRLVHDNSTRNDWPDDIWSAIEEALAEQAAVKESLTTQDPVAWAYEYGTDRGDAVNEIRWYQNLTALDKPKPVEGGLIRNVRPLYAAPVRTKDLTDDEERQIIAATVEGVTTSELAMFKAVVRAAIAADREKNRG